MELCALSNRELMRIHSGTMTELYARDIIRSNGQPINEFARYHFLKLKENGAWQGLVEQDPWLGDIPLEDIEFLGFKSTFMRRTNEWLNLGSAALPDKPWICLVIFSSMFELFDAFLIPQSVFVQNFLIEDSTSKYQRQLFNLLGEWREQETTHSLTASMMEIPELISAYAGRSE